MQYILNCGQMKEADRYTIEEIGIPSMVLMERAALSVVEEMEQEGHCLGKVLVVCGTGNNGGDGWAIARLLHLKGYKVFVECVGNPEKMTAETRMQYKIAGNYQIPVVNNPEYGEYTTIVDALFGVGLSRPVEGDYKRKIEKINAGGAFIWSVDIPSGIDGDTGKVMGTAVRADATVTFAFAKIGHVRYPGRVYTGRLCVKDIGIYSIAKERDQYACSLDETDAFGMLHRDPGGHKGTFGKVLVLAGSHGMSGAAYFAGSAAYGAGAGMVKICTTEDNRQILQTLLPEALYGTWEEEGLREAMDWCSAVVTGPGISKSREAADMLRLVLELGRQRNLPMVLDADGLNLIAAFPEYRDMLYENCVYTPHMLELSRMMNQKAADMLEQPFSVLEEFAGIYPGTLVWKDACTIVRGGGGKIYLNRSGNEGMASAGSGDVLAGLLGGLLAGEMAPEQAVPLGVYLHGKAGDCAKEQKGSHAMTARDILEGISPAVRRAASKAEI